jgi:hypothetical protein
MVTSIQTYFPGFVETRLVLTRSVMRGCGQADLAFAGADHADIALAGSDHDDSALAGRSAR